jgi:hypothetical protein
VLLHERHRPATKKRKLRLIVEKLVEKAIEGDNWCIGQIGDRLDGKPKKKQEHVGLMEHSRTLQPTFLVSSTRFTTPADSTPR